MEGFDSNSQSSESSLINCISYESFNTAVLSRDQNINIDDLWQSSEPNTHPTMTSYWFDGTVAEAEQMLGRYAIVCCLDEYELTFVVFANKDVANKTTDDPRFTSKLAAMEIEHISSEKR